MSEAQYFVATCQENIRDTLAVLQSIRPPADMAALISSLEELETRLSTLPAMLENGAANPVSTEAFVWKLLYYLFQTEQLSQKWIANWEDDDEEDVSILLSKFIVFSEMFEPAIKVPADDLIFLPRAHPRWELMKRHTRHKVVADVNELLEATQEFLKNIAVSNAFMSKGFEVQTNSYYRKLTLGASMVYYGLSKERAMRRTRYFYSKPNSNAAFAVWNLTDSQLVAPFYSAVCPSIEVSSVVFLPRVASLEEDHSTKHFALEGDQRPNHVPIRLICAVPILKLTEFDPNKCCQPPKPPQFNQLVIHIHGGGFVSMSSSSHQSYTRRWASSLQVPIVSIDYRLAPKHKYPAAPEDVWDAYIWLILNGESELGIRPDKVVIVGDSAGGNLAIAITNKALDTGFRVPDGLLLAYPCVTLNRKIFSYSLMLTLEDMLLPFKFLEMCLDSYLNETDDPCTDYYLSPLLTPEANLARFPRTHLVFGTKDPLYDDCLRFFERLLLAGVDAKATEYEGMMHGFLSFDIKMMGIEGCSKVVADVGETLADLVGNQGS
jgi:hormone-sensitive lipase